MFIRGSQKLRGLAASREKKPFHAQALRRKTFCERSKMRRHSRLKILAQRREDAKKYCVVKKNPRDSVFIRGSQKLRGLAASRKKKAFHTQALRRKTLCERSKMRRHPKLKILAQRREDAKKYFVVKNIRVIRCLSVVPKNFAA